MGLSLAIGRYWLVLDCFGCIGAFHERVTNFGGARYIQAHERALREALSQERCEEDEDLADEREGNIAYATERITWLVW